MADHANIPTDSNETERDARSVSTGEPARASAAAAGAGEGAATRVSDASRPAGSPAQGAQKPSAGERENAPGEPAQRTANGAARGAARRKSNMSTYIVLTCIAILLALTVLGGLLNVGDHLMAVHPALGWLFYGLLVVLVVVGIVVPVIKVAKRPIFSLYQLRDEQGHAKRRHCRMLVDNLIENTDLTDEEVAKLEGFLEQGDKADDLLIDFFNAKCVPLIDAETKRAAGSAFFVAAISRSPLVSTVTMLSICLDLVRSIVEICGFRPTNLGLARLYTRVMLSALIIGGLEDSDLGDLLGQLMGGGAGARAGGFLLGSTAEGLMSAFLVFRVGVITKRWLTAADGPARMASIRRTSYREALAQMRSSDFMSMVADTVKRTGETVATGVANSVANAAKSKWESAKEAFFR